MELQANLPALRATGIAPLALSYDNQAVLAAFAAERGITFPLLADEGGTVIRRLGLMNPGYDTDHPRHGVAQPATYLLDEAGRVTEAIVHTSQTVRDAWRTALREVAAELAGADLIERSSRDGLIVTVALDSATFRARQRIGLRARVDLAPNLHVYGRPLPEGYTPVTLIVEPPPGVLVEPVSYPAAQAMRLAGETLPVYTGRVEMTTHLICEEPREDIVVRVTVALQACTETDCLLPQRVAVELPVRFVPLD